MLPSKASWHCALLDEAADVSDKHNNIACSYPQLDVSQPKNTEHRVTSLNNCKQAVPKWLIVENSGHEPKALVFNKYSIPCSWLESLFEMERPWDLEYCPSILVSDGFIKLMSLPLLWAFACFWNTALGPCRVDPNMFLSCVLKKES